METTAGGEPSAGAMAALAAMGVGVIIVAVIVGLAISALICWYLSGCLKRVPAEHRKQSPGMVWLLMIPCFPIVWNFFVYPKIAESFKSYFDSVGRTDVGDCGRKNAMIFSILCVAGLIGVVPVVGMIAPLINIAALVFWIIVLVKFGGLKGQIQEQQQPQA